MKIISVEIKKIAIGKFFPKEDKVELSISFNDGSDKEILKVVDISDADRASEITLLDIRKLEKNIHKIDESNELVADNYVNIIIKDEDNVIKELSAFILKVGTKINEIKEKEVAEGYLDVIRELKNLKVEF